MPIGAARPPRPSFRHLVERLVVLMEIPPDDAALPVGRAGWQFPLSVNIKTFILMTGQDAANLLRCE